MIKLRQDDVVVCAIEVLCTLPSDRDRFPMYYLPEEPGNNKVNDFYKELNAHGLQPVGIRQFEHNLYTRLAYSGRQSPDEVRDIVQAALEKHLVERNV
jgi:hypothetical protein